jgi:hypothetical protein
MAYEMKRPIRAFAPANLRPAVRAEESMSLLGIHRASALSVSAAAPVMSLSARLTFARFAYALP